MMPDPVQRLNVQNVFTEDQTLWPRSAQVSRKIKEEMIALGRDVRRADCLILVCCPPKTLRMGPALRKPHWTESGRWADGRRAAQLPSSNKYEWSGCLKNSEMEVPGISVEQADLSSCYIGLTEVFIQLKL